MPFYPAILSVQRIYELKNIHCCLIYRSKKLEATEVSINGDLMICHQMGNHPVLGEKNDMTLCNDIERVVLLHSMSDYVCVLIKNIKDIHNSL